MPDVTTDPHLLAVETSMLPAVLAVHQHSIGFQEASRIWRYFLVKETVRITGNQNRAAIKLGMSHVWVKRVMEEGPTVIRKLGKPRKVDKQ